MAMRTWKDLRATLPAGLTPEDYDDIRRLTAPGRQELRAREARVAACAFVSEIATRGLIPYGDVSRLATALLWAESRGLSGGGTQDPGAGTTRHPAFRSLGKGRRSARDGGAWTAAIAAAAGQVEVELDDRGAVRWDTYGNREIIPWGDLLWLLDRERAAVLARGLVREGHIQVGARLLAAVRAEDGTA